MVTPLVAALHGKHFQVAELLHRHGADIDVRNSSQLALLSAAYDLDITEWLLNHGADVNTHGNQIWTQLHGDVAHGNTQRFRMLIEHNADIHFRSGVRGRMPLHLAASPYTSRGHVDNMQLLLDHGADPNARDDDGSTPLHQSSWWKEGNYAETHGTVEGTRLLLKYGAIIDAEDNEGRTPLQLALEHRRNDIVACLKEHGATR
jgi:ankyrin repeat protein